MIPVYILILFVNYIFGTNKIIDAHEHQFRGGMCGSCESCNEPACDSKSGFDIYYLYFSLLLFSFVVGATNTISDKSLLFSTVVSFISAIVYLVLTELIIKLFAIPVLYTHFQEGRQSLLTSAFSRFSIIYNIFPLFLSVISSFVGNIIGFPFLVLVKKVSGNRLR